MFISINGMEARFVLASFVKPPVLTKKPLSSRWGYRHTGLLHRMAELGCGRPLAGGPGVLYQSQGGGFGPNLPKYVVHRSLVESCRGRPGLPPVYRLIASGTIEAKILRLHACTPARRKTRAGGPAAGRNRADGASGCSGNPDPIAS